MIKTIYTDILTRLQSELNNTVKHYGLWNNQIGNEQIEKPFRFPALFIEFTDIPYRSEGYGSQKIDLGFSVHCVFSQLIQDLDMLDVVNQVGLTLHGFALDYSTNITRVSEVQDVDRDRLTDWVINFVCTITVDDAVPVQNMTQTTPTSLGVTAQLDIDNNVIRSGDGTI